MERSENKTKKKRKIAIIFASTRNKAKRKRKTIIFASKRNEAKQKQKMPSFSLRSEMEAKLFRFDAKKVFFRLFSHLKRNENEIKQKQSEKTFISFRIEAKRKDRKRIGSETKRQYTITFAFGRKRKIRSEKKRKFFFCEPGAP